MHNIMTTELRQAPAVAQNHRIALPANFVYGGLWLLLAMSSFVMIEPAPFDLLAVGFISILFMYGLRVPRALGLPMLLIAAVTLANLVSIIFAKPNAAQPLPYMAFYAALTVYLLVLWLFFSCLVAADPERTYRIVWQGWTFAAVTAALIGLAAYFQLLPGHEHFMHVGRVKGPFKDPNVFSPFLIPVALYMLATMGRGTTIERLLRFAVFLLMAFGLLLGFSRGAWGHFILSLLVFAALSFATTDTLRQYFKFFAASAIVMVATTAIVITAISTPQIGQMLKKRAALVQKYDVEQGGRFSTQLASLREIAVNPIGLGPNRTYAEFGRVPHNLYLKIAAENGWLGGIAFLIFIVISLWRGFWFALRRTVLQKPYIVVYATVFGIAAESVVIDTLHWRHFFVLLGMLWGPTLVGRALDVPATAAPRAS